MKVNKGFYSQLDYFLTMWLDDLLFSFYFNGFGKSDW